MTAKHRRGKGNHKHEDNFFKNEVTESEVRPGVNQYALHLVLFLLLVIGGATGSWFCFQQHQTLTYLTDNLMGMQMKIVKLQSSHEELRQTSNKQHITEVLESRLNALEDSHSLAQKQVGMALAAAEQLKTTEIPAQVLSLSTEMTTRLAEMQHATASLDQLNQLQTMLNGKSEEFDAVRIQVEGLAALSAELSEKQQITEILESRLNALEDSHSVAQKDVGMALATAEQLKTTDLPSQVMSLHSEMTKRLADMQHATASLEQLNQLQTVLEGKSDEFDGVRIQIEGLATLSAELSKKIEVLTGNMGEVESKLEKKAQKAAKLSTTLDGQAAEVLRLKEQLDTYQAQLEANTLEMGAVRELVESEQALRLQKASVQEQLGVVRQHSELRAQLESKQKPIIQEMDKTQVEQAEVDTAPAVEVETAPAAEEEAAPAAEEETAAAADEEEALPADTEQEAEADESEGEAAAQDEAPVEQEHPVMDEAAPAEEEEAVTEDQTEQDESVALSEETAEGVQSEEPEEQNQEAEEEEEQQQEEVVEEEVASVGVNGLEVSEGEEDAAEEATDEGAEPLEEDEY